MEFKVDHVNLNVLDLERSLAFYKEALGLKQVREIKADDGSFTLAFLSDEDDTGKIELTCLHNRTDPYDLGDNETHIAFVAANFDAAYQKHTQMGCICFENKDMGIYFIEDPDGYWLEVIPPK